MRLNRFIASSSVLSRRKADEAIANGNVLVNGKTPEQGMDITDADVVQLYGKELKHTTTVVTIMLNKPVGYVVSRDGQGSLTVFDLLPPEYKQLQPVGRLDKYSSGLLLFTNDGQLAQELTHPSRQKVKVYEIVLGKPLQPLHQQMISDTGIMLDDGVSKLQLDRLRDSDDTAWRVTMHEGRNRQIRRTFEALSYHVAKLHRVSFGDYTLGTLRSGSTKTL